jgi:LysM repeat protein
MRLSVSAGLALAFIAGVSGCASNGTTTVDEKKVTEVGPDSGAMDPGGVAVRPVEPYRPVEPITQPAPAPAPSPMFEPITPAPAPDPGLPAAPTKTYVVQKGDTLYSIAAKVYGFTTAHEKNVGATKIFEANKAMMGDRDKIKVGMKLTIPVKPEMRSTTSAPSARTPARPAAAKTTRRS